MPLLHSWWGHDKGSARAAADLPYRQGWARGGSPLKIAHLGTYYAIGPMMRARALRFGPTKAPRYEAR